MRVMTTRGALSLGHSLVCTKNKDTHERTDMSLGNIIAVCTCSRRYYYTALYVDTLGVVTFVGSFRPNKKKKKKNEWTTKKYMREFSER
jgi:hypothetical protein